jgi:hypothetical protein
MPRSCGSRARSWRVTASPVTNPNTGEVSDTLVPQANAYEVYAEHIRALNACDWVAILAQ